MNRKRRHVHKILKLHHQSRRGRFRSQAFMMGTTLAAETFWSGLELHKSLEKLRSEGEITPEFAGMIAGKEGGRLCRRAGRAEAEEEGEGKEIKRERREKSRVN